MIPLKESRSQKVRTTEILPLNLKKKVIMNSAIARKWTCGNLRELWSWFFLMHHLLTLSICHFLFTPWLKNPLPCNFVSNLSWKWWFVYSFALWDRHFNQDKLPQIGTLHRLSIGNIFLKYSLTYLGEGRRGQATWVRKVFKK